MQLFSANPAGDAWSRRLALSCVAGACVVATVTARRVDGDWALFVGSARAMFGSDGLAVYGHRVNIQSGPIALLAVGGIDEFGPWGLPIAIATLGLVTIFFVARARAARQHSARDVPFIVGGAVLMLWWPYLKTSGHLDDAMVLTIAAAGLALVLRGRTTVAAVLFGLAIAIKPWSVMLVPLTLHDVRVTVRPVLTWRVLRAPVISLGVAAAIWSPFLLADSRALDGLEPTVWLAPDAVLRLFGAHTTVLTSQLRIAQLVLALAVATMVVLRGRPAGALLAGVAVRMLLDGGTWNYYSVGFVLGALLWDLCATDRRLPWATCTGTILLAPAWVVGTHEIRAILRLTACLCALAMVLWPERSRETAVLT